MDIATIQSALRGIADDYMTSERHHPGYVLIPAAKFEELCAAARSLDSLATAGSGSDEARIPPRFGSTPDREEALERCLGLLRDFVLMPGRPLSNRTLLGMERDLTLVKYGYNPSPEHVLRADEARVLKGGDEPSIPTKSMSDLEAVDWESLDAMFARIPSGPYAHHVSGDFTDRVLEVRAIDTDPTNKHHYPYRLCRSIVGQFAACDDDVFGFIAGVINSWPQISSLAAQVGNQPLPESAPDDLDARLAAAGMYTTAQMLGTTPLTKWQTHSGMDSIEFYAKWLDRRAAEFLRMKARYELGDKPKDDELYEWVLAHSAAFGEARINLRAALQGSSVQARSYAVDLEQCSLFVDSPPLKRAMTDAAEFLRSLSPPDDLVSPTSGKK